MIKCFEGLADIESVKAVYKTLAKKYHPDLGGCVETMKELNRQYEQALGGAYQAAGKTATETDDLLAECMEVAEKLYEILAIPGVLVELCGNWLWVTGDTRPARDLLKQAGFLWASKKLAWYWRKDTERKRRYGSMDLASIRARHGSEVIKNINKREYIAA
jgi:hypothetical protein